MQTKIDRFEKLGDFRLRVHFNNGDVGEHDFSNLIQQPGEMREPMRDAPYFARGFLDFGALTWPNGYDIAPEWLRREMASAHELHRIAAE